VTFWLADLIDERGWGLRDDTFTVMDALRALGDDIWFNLGDRDLAWCLRRAQRLAEGATPTEALAEGAAALARRAAAAELPEKADRRFAPEVLRAISRVWSRTAAMEIVVDGARWIAGCGGDPPTERLAGVLAGQDGLIEDMGVVADAVYGRSAA
jgi:hypothetical protein